MYSLCPNCDFLFVSKVIGANNAALIVPRMTKMSFENIAVNEPCPRCGHTAHMLIGEYQVDIAGITSFLSGPKFSTETLERFNVLVKKAKEQNYAPEQFVEEAKKISPLFSRLNEFIPKGTKEVVFGILAGVATNLISDAIKTEQPQVVNNTTIIYNNGERALPPNPYKFSGNNKKGIKKKRKNN